MAQKVVIAGAGFGGVRVAKGLQGQAEVTVVTPRPRFVFRPLIHELLSDRETPTSVSKSLQDIIPGVRVVEDAVLAVEGNEAVTAAGRRIAFDHFVSAVGAEPNDFGVPGVREHTHSFYTVDDALAANAAIKQAVVRKDGPVRIAIAGASFTGVEVAGEAAELLRQMGAPYQITLVEAMTSIFPSQDQDFQDAVKEGLDRLDIQVMLNCPIKETRADRFVVDSPEQEVRADVLLWCAGIRPKPIAGVSPQVRPTLQSEDRDDIWIVGDAAVFPRDAMVAKLAQTAEKQGPIVAHNILHPDRMKTYEPKLRGLIISIGHDYAVAQLTGGPVMKGKVPHKVKEKLYKAKIAFL